MALLTQPKDELTTLVDRMVSDFPFIDFTVPKLAYAVPIDLYEKDGAYVLEMPVAGFEAKDLNVEVTGNTITVSALRTEKEEKAVAKYHRREIRKGSFTRSVSLPQDIDTNKIDAQVQHGFLTITLWPVKPIAPKKVQVIAH